MANTTQIEGGSVVSLWRYPVTSMKGSPNVEETIYWLNLDTALAEFPKHRTLTGGHAEESP